MSPTIWTRCGARANLRRLALTAWRVVEGQHVVSTRKLVDSDAEQALLEELLEEAKPPLPRGPEFQGLHYLLATPFRYPPLAHGSRFGRRWERGIWYGSETLRAAFAEAAYYRLVFLAGSEADLEPLAVDVSAFTAAVRTPHGVDLTGGPFAAFDDRISSPTRYEEAQELGFEMRGDGVEAFRYRSARDRDGGANVGLFTPRAFSRRRPATPEPWYCVATRDAVEFSKRDVFERRSVRIERGELDVDGQLPSPAL